MIIERGVQGSLQHTSKTVTFTGATTLGEIGSVPLFTVTGRVLVRYIVAFCGTTLAGASATIALGTVTAANNGFFIAATTATTISTNDIWIDTSVDEQGVATITAGQKEAVVSEDITATVAVADVTGGVLTVDVFYYPITAGANLA